jgi:RNA-directed DNA polymerase
VERRCFSAGDRPARVCCLPAETFDFLGYTIGRCYSPKTGKAHLGTIPSRKRVQRLCQQVSELTGRRSTQQDAETMVGTLNRKLLGWSNYFCLGSVSKAYRAVDQHATRRLRQWLCAKYQAAGQGTRRFSDATLHLQFGLLRLAQRTGSVPCAKT